MVDWEVMDRIDHSYSDNWTHELPCFYSEEKRCVMVKRYHKTMLSLWLQAMNDKYGLTPKIVSRDLGISLDTIYKWKNGTRRPRLKEKVRRISEYTGMSPDELNYEKKSLH